VTVTVIHFSCRLIVLCSLFPTQPTRGYVPDDREMFWLDRVQEGKSLEAVS